MQLFKQFRSVFTLSLVLTLLLGYNFINAAWTAPAGAPSAATNTPAPINVGATTQDKNGNLLANIFAAANHMRSDRYCDSLGQNCFTPASIPNPTAIKCPSGQAVTAITSDGKATCGNVSAPSGPVCETQSVTLRQSGGCDSNLKCPSGYFLMTENNPGGKCDDRNHIMTCGKQVCQ